MKSKFFYSLVLCCAVSSSLHAKLFYGSRVYNIYEAYCTLFKDGYAHELTEDQASELFMGYANPDWTTYTQSHDAVLLNKISEIKTRKLLSEMYGELIDARLHELIKDSLKIWIRQGEFEKYSDYQNRLKGNFNTVFERCCRDLFQPTNYRIIPLHYDVNKEKYTIEIDYEIPKCYNLVDYFTGYPYEEQHNTDTYWGTRVGSEIFTINMCVEDARYLKEHYGQTPILDIVFGMREYSVLPYSFSFVINGRKYDAKNYNMRDFVVNVANLELGTDSSYNVVKYNYTSQRKQLIEKNTAC